MKKSIKKILNYIKENKFYLMIMLIGFILLLLHMRNVVMYADDFGLKVKSLNGMGYIIEKQIKHYFSWGGGFTPILVMTFLLFKFSVWKIFISALITAIFFLIIKMLNFDNEKEKVFAALTLWSLFFLISIYVLNQTIYWLDGCFAYVFTVIQVVLYVYFIITRIFLEKTKKYDKWLFPLVAFFGGWSSAQSGAIVLILPILVIGYLCFFKKKKISKINIISIILGMVGFAIFYFAPGNYARMEKLAYFSELSFIEKILYRIPTIFRYLLDFKNISFNSTPFYILLMTSLLIILVSHYLKKDKNKNIVVKISLLYCLTMLLFYMMIAINTIGSDILTKYLLTFQELFKTNIPVTLSLVTPYIASILFVISTIVMMFYVFIKTKSPVGINCILAAYISQFVMVMAHDTAYRTTFIIIMFIIITIVDLIKICYREKISFYYISCIPFVIYQWQFGLVMMLIMLFLESIFDNKKNNNLQLIAMLFMIFISAMFNYYDIYKKYQENKIIYIENVNSLENYNGESEIHLKKYLNDEGCFGNMIGEEWVENDIKKLYKIDKSVKFIEE